VNMKPDKIFHLSWSVLTALLVTIDTTFTGLVSAAPALLSRSLPKIGNVISNGLPPESDSPNAFDVPTDTKDPLSKRRLAPYWSTRQVSAEHIRKRDYPSAAITPEEKPKSEYEGGVDLSKRLQQRPSSALVLPRGPLGYCGYHLYYHGIRRSSPSSSHRIHCHYSRHHRNIPIKARLPVGSPVVYKREIFITTTAEAEAPESESEDGIHFSKRRVMVYGRVRYVGHPDFHKHDFLSTASPDDERP
ncbi:hypothetical protein BG015_001215, partial [Linnemannia schmuckeri]